MPDPTLTRSGMLTGQSATAEPGLVFYDAWEVAGDGTAGHDVVEPQPFGGRPVGNPDRRFDYVLSAWPRNSEGWGTPSIASCSASYRTTSFNSRTTTESLPTSGTGGESGF